MTQAQQTPIDAFRAHFDRDPTLLARAPGRVNLIGEHTDYNDGFVLPIAIDRDILIAGAPTGTQQVRLYSINFDQHSRFSLDAITPSQAEPWSNYIRGVLWALAQAGHAPGGFDAVIAGDVPLGAGLSSSAALEVAAMTLCNTLFTLRLSHAEIARLAQKAENDFVGVHCGIMDQMISAAGMAGHAVLIDCRSLDLAPVRVPDGVAVVVCNSMVQRGLVDSAYNERREQCEAAAAQFGVPALRDVTAEQFEARRDALPDLVRMRAEHVIYENARTQKAADALNVGDMAAVGRLFGESHASMRELFEITVPAIDTLVEIAQTDPVCYGSRMTGGGFGGCTVSLAPAGEAEAFGARLAAAYKEATGKDAPIYICKPAAGSSTEPV